MSDATPLELFKQSSITLTKALKARGIDAKLSTVQEAMADALDQDNFRSIRAILSSYAPPPEVIDLDTISFEKIVTWFRDLVSRLPVDVTTVVEADRACVVIEAAFYAFIEMRDKGLLILTPNTVYDWLHASKFVPLRYDDRLSTKTQKRIERALLSSNFYLDGVRVERQPESFLYEMEYAQSFLRRIAGQALPYDYTSEYHIEALMALVEGLNEKHGKRKWFFGSGSNTELPHIKSRLMVITNSGFLLSVDLCDYDVAAFIEDSDAYVLKLNREVLGMSPSEIDKVMQERRGLMEEKIREIEGQIAIEEKVRIKNTSKISTPGGDAIPVE